MSIYYLTPNGDGTKSGIDWDNAGDNALLTTLLTTGGAQPGDIVYLYSGSYSTATSIPSANGLVSNRLTYIGVSNKESLTPAQGIDRPQINTGAVYFRTPTYTDWANINITNSHQISMSCNTGALMMNCEVKSTYSGTANCVLLTNAGSVINCSVIGTYVNTTGDLIGINDPHGYKIQMNNFIIDCKIGINCGRYYLLAIGNIIVNCSDYGIYYPNIAANSSLLVNNNTIYNCGRGMYFNTTYTIITASITNNIICNCNVGIENTLTSDVIYSYYNNFWNNTTDVINFKKGCCDLAFNPLFTDTTSNDFSLQASSPLINAGLSVNQGIG